MAFLRQLLMRSLFAPGLENCFTHVLCELVCHYGATPFDVDRTRPKREQSNREPDRLFCSARKHQRPHEREQEDSHSKSECNDAYPALLKFCRRTGEEKHSGTQNSIREVLTGNIAGVARFLGFYKSFLMQ
jgi:hypothetical protein